MTNKAALIAEAAQIYRVLGNSIRIDILYFLREQTDYVTVSTIIAAMSLPQSVVSKHLGVLFRYQLVAKKRVGTRILYRFDDPHIVELVDDMMNHVKHEIKGEPHVNA